MHYQRIDFHHHITPEFYLEMLASIGIRDSLGHAFPEWTPEKSLTFMKKNGIAKAMLSVSTPGVCVGDDAFARTLARECNEFMARTKEGYHGRFGGFAALPATQPEAAADEAAYAFGTLGLDGVGLLSHYDGIYLGDARYDPLFEELNRRRAVVFLHPTDPTGVYDPELGIPNALIEAPFETTRAVTNMLYTGVLERYPDITFVLAHGGGTLPYIGWRAALIRYGKKGEKPPLIRSFYDFLVKHGPETGLRLLKQMYYDTALVSGTAALGALKEFAGPGHIVFGSDFPFAKLAPVVSSNLRRYMVASEAEFAMVDHENGETLLNGTSVPLN